MKTVVDSKSHRAGLNGFNAATASATGIGAGAAGAAVVKAKGLLLLGKGAFAVLGVVAAGPLGVGLAIGTLATLLYGANAMRSSDPFRQMT
ncbi:MAG: hypothetical protein HQL45_07880 [Alphaproteobacteria bacterium]|nr:hypothetical protein [Alphaproteobacteria bacterium]